MLRTAMISVVLLLIVIAPPAAAQSQPPGIPCDAFRKNPDGSWTANRHLDIRTRNGPVSVDPGSAVRAESPPRGIDLAQVLNDRCGS